ncbi:sensor histidine kinase [Melittangium boletus]|uniref:sensor histidine kinase n=1 Tax=Melittangium boletus TaxID=83453 RepID=UPI003DA60E70
MGPSSLTTRLVVALAGALAVLALVLGLGGAWLIHGVVERSGDRVLAGSVGAIAETLALEDGELTLDLPPAAFGMLENAEHDNVYYAVRHQGRLVTGYADLPFAEQIPPRDTVAFRYEAFRGQSVRIATVSRLIPRLKGAVVVQVAETLQARDALRARMVGGLALLEGALLLGAALTARPALRWGLRPLARSRALVEDKARAAPVELTALPLAPVPAEIRPFVEAVNALLARLEESTVRMRRFTGDASHQMRTPLAVLRMHLALALRPEATQAERAAALRDVEGATLSLERLLTQLLALVRAEERGALPALQRVELNGAVAQVTADFVPQALRARVEVHFEGHASEVFVRADPVLVREVVGNLLDNALRYHRPGGLVAVRVVCVDAVPWLEIEDNGPGIPPEERERVFQRFHRLPRDQSQSGSGLGLSIVRSLAEHMAAEVVLRDGREGVGLTAAVRFQAWEPVREASYQR